MLVGAEHVIVLFIDEHLERQYVVVYEEEVPLATFGNGWRLGKDIDDRKPVFHAEGHEHPRHNRKMKTHVALIGVPKIRNGIFGPLVGLGDQHTIAESLVHLLSKLLQE